MLTYGQSSLSLHVCGVSFKKAQVISLPKEKSKPFRKKMSSHKEISQKDVSKRISNGLSYTAAIYVRFGQRPDLLFKWFNTVIQRFWIFRRFSKEPLDVFQRRLLILKVIKYHRRGVNQGVVYRHWRSAWTNMHSRKRVMSRSNERRTTIARFSISLWE